MGVIIFSFRLKKKLYRSFGVVYKMNSFSQFSIAIELCFLELFRRENFTRINLLFFKFDLGLQNFKLIVGLVFVLVELLHL